MTDRSLTWEQWGERWGPQPVFGALLLALGLAEALVGYRGAASGPGHPLLLLTFALAVAVSRVAPGAALAIVWGAGTIQVLTGTPVSLLELSVAVVAYGCARWGSAATVVLSGLSIPAGAVIAVALVRFGSFDVFSRLAGSRDLIRGAYRFSDTLLVGATILGVLVLAVPWLAGLVVRYSARATASLASQEVAEAQTAQAQQETEQAQEIARLRDEQARLARDVHDVVGHSLAVILAQAESAQYLPDEDPARLKQTLATIATSARGSLQDVRQVLAGPDQAPPPAAPGRFDQLLDGVRAGGHEVVATEVGVPRPLPPELEVVAHRVAQEMLTNAIKHGRRGATVRVERHWPEGAWDRDLRIEVRNVADLPPPLDETQPVQSATDTPPGASDGRGLDGMRRRLDSVGGRLDVRRRDEPDGPTFTATAWVPVSDR